MTQFTYLLISRFLAVIDILVNEEIANNRYGNQSN